MQNLDLKNEGHEHKKELLGWRKHQWWGWGEREGKGQNMIKGHYVHILKKTIMKPI
jgi:hypothetical protein